LFYIQVKYDVDSVEIFCVHYNRKKLQSFLRMSSTVEFKKVVVLLACLSMTGVGCKPQSWGI